uniref:Uncharacterized protein n=1 Tax=Anguilla anguilla TaxID=7936 RepID=A0A0E9R0P6_ANGAN
MTFIFMFYNWVESILIHRAHCPMSPFV